MSLMEIYRNKPNFIFPLFYGTAKSLPQSTPYIDLCSRSIIHVRMASHDKLKHLLDYSTSLSSSDAPAPSSTTAATTAAKSDRILDASMLDEIMGPDDAKLMLQSMTAIEDASLPAEHHEIAFENLEALVEQIDNAKNLRNLNLWSPVLAQLEKPDALFRIGGCSVIATAVQNNPVSQGDFLNLDGLRRVLALFASDPDLGVRKKALFAVTSTIRNNPLGLTQFAALDGWRIFSDYLSELRDAQMQKRIIFFLRTIYTSPTTTETTNESEEVPPVVVADDVKTGFPPKLVQLLQHQKVQQDEDLAEKILQTLLASLSVDREVLNRELKKKLTTLAESMRRTYGEDMCQFDTLFKLLQ